MGAICSKAGTLKGGHKVIGTTQTLGGTGAGGEGNTPTNPRLAALKAAESRKQVEQKRGTSDDNPNAGKLSSLLASRNASKGTEPQQPDRLVWD